MNRRTMGGTIRIAAIGAAGVVVAGLSHRPVAVAASHGRTGYAHVSRASRLPAGAHRSAAAAPASASVARSPSLRATRPHCNATQSPSPTRGRRATTTISRRAHSRRPTDPRRDCSTPVEAALRAGHLTVTSVSSNHMFVHFTGSVGDAESAFRTRLADYRMANGRTGMATTAPVSLPASIAPQVVSVLGLNTLLKSSTSFERGSHKSAPKAGHPDDRPLPGRRRTRARRRPAQPTTSAGSPTTRSPTLTASTGCTRTATSAPARPSRSSSSSRSR